MGVRHLRLCVISTVIAALCVACSSSSRQIDSRNQLVLVYEPVALTDEVTVKDVTCREGDVLLGAGYRVDGVDVTLQKAVAVLENRPSSDTAWRVKVVRQTGTEPSEVNFSLYLYCLHRSGGSPAIVSAEMRSGPGTPLDMEHPTGFTTGSSSIACPSGRTLTSGGFAVDRSTPDTHQDAANLNGWVMSSRPSTDLRSWTVSGSFFIDDQVDVIATATSYAMCVFDPAKVLKPVAADEVEAEREETGAYFGHLLSGVAPCPGDGFATAGGFDLTGNHFVPRSILTSQATFQFKGWDVRGVFGSQEDEDLEALTVQPLCFAPVDVAAPDQIDLLPLLRDDPVRESACPGSAPFCFDFTVINAGTVSSAPTVAEVRSLGEAPVRVDIPALEAGESTELTAVISNPCFDNCSVTVTVDPDNAVAEADETNNSAQWKVVG